MQLMEHRYSGKDYVTSKGTSQNIHNEYTIYSGKDYVTIDARVILLWEPTISLSQLQIPKILCEENDRVGPTVIESVSGLKFCSTSMVLVGGDAVRAPNNWFHLSLLIHNTQIMIKKMYF